MEEGIISWLFLFIVFSVLFRYLNKRRPVPLTWLHIVAVCICLTGIAVLSAALHWVVMTMFDVDTAGFLNMNEFFIFLACWVASAIVALVVARYSAIRLQPVYKTVRVTATILGVLPILFLFVLVVISL